MQYKAPPAYDIIVAATSGEPEAVVAILNHYSAYIESLATTNHFDVEANCQFEAKLMEALFKFRL